MNAARKAKAAFRPVAPASPEPPRADGGALPLIMTVKEVAAAFRVSTPTIYSLIRSGDLPAIVFSTRAGRGVVRVRAEDARAFLDRYWGAR